MLEQHLFKFNKIDSDSDFFFNNLIFSEQENVEQKEIENELKTSESLNSEVFIGDIGKVILVGDGIAKIDGLINVQANEMLIFASNITFPDVTFVFSFKFRV